MCFIYINNNAPACRANELGLYHTTAHEKARSGSCCGRVLIALSMQNQAWANSILANRSSSEMRPSARANSAWSRRFSSVSSATRWRSDSTSDPRNSDLFTAETN